MVEEQTVINIIPQGSKYLNSTNMAMVEQQTVINIIP
jgi:hypothetical protein